MSTRLLVFVPIKRCHVNFHNITSSIFHHNKACSMADCYVSRVGSRFKTGQQSVCLPGKISSCSLSPVLMAVSTSSDTVKSEFLFRTFVSKLQNAKMAIASVMKFWSQSHFINDLCGSKNRHALAVAFIPQKSPKLNPLASGPMMIFWSNVALFCFVLYIVFCPNYDGLF